MRNLLLLFVLLSGAYYVYFGRDIANAQLPYWDEATYVNAARTYATAVKPYPNPEHPPLGKVLLVVGMRLFGDTPQGWRFFATLAGSMSGALLVLLVHRFTKRWGVAAFVGLLYLWDPLLYLHFRLGMLDPPLLFFLMAALFSVLKFWDSSESRSPWLYALGLFLGLALVTKLLTLVLMPAFYLLVAIKFRKEGTSWSAWLFAILPLFVLPLLLFFGTYRLIGYGFSETVDLVTFNFGFHHFHSGSANVSSRWYEWLYVGQPVWYFWRQIDAAHFQGVLGTGNLILWVGAELLALYALFQNRRRLDVWMVASLVLIQFGLYAFKTRTFLQYMVLILPFLYLLMGIGIGTLFQRYEKRYNRLLQIDFACFFLGSLFVFWNYFPYIHGEPMTRQAFESVGAKTLPLPPKTKQP